MFVFFFCAATPLLKAWLGTRYSPLLPTTFRIMAGSAYLSLLGFPAYQLFIGLGRVRHVFISTFIRCSINVVVIASLMWLGFQATPARVAVAVLIATGVGNGYLLVYEVYLRRSAEKRGMANES